MMGGWIGVEDVKSGQSAVVGLSKLNRPAGSGTTGGFLQKRLDGCVTVAQGEPQKARSKMDTGMQA